MQYSKHFASVVREVGQPRLSTTAFRKMMNVVSLEGTINGLLMAQRKNPKEPKKYGLQIAEKKKDLNLLTENKPPLEFMYQLTLESRDTSG